MILVIPPRAWVDSAGQGDSDGFADMRIGHLATLRVKGLGLPSFFQLLGPHVEDSRADHLSMPREVTSLSCSSWFSVIAASGPSEVIACVDE